MSATDVEHLIRSFFDAYHAADRPRVEALLHPDFSFTSPYDDHIGREAWFERCWPGAGSFKFMEIVGIMSGDGAAYVTYEALTATDQAIRNTELMRIDGGRLKSVEVFFGRPTT